MLGVVATGWFVCGVALSQSLLQPDPVCNLLGAGLVAVSSGPGIQIEREDDGTGLTVRLRAGSTTGRVQLGPVSLSADVGVLRFTGALSLAGNPTCQLSATFSSDGAATGPIDIPFSGHAARVEDVFQDVFIPVPPGADSAMIVFALTQTDDAEAVFRLGYPCLTTVPRTGPREFGGGAVAFRQTFSHADGRADVVSDAVSLYPAWSCVLPTAMGKAGPGLRARRAQDAAVFTLPGQQELAARGYVNFWLKPLWDQGDAQPADMIKLTQGGRPNLLIRKNHGWSFLFVVWDRDKKTHGVSCDLRNLVKGQWTKIEGVWDAEKGVRLIVNGVTLGKKDTPWAVSSTGAIALRIGQGEHDTKEPAPYVLDEIEILTHVPEEAFLE